MKKNTLFNLIFCCLSIAWFNFSLLGIVLGIENGIVNKPKLQYNVILIVVDALRTDHLGRNGYFRNTSGNIDALAKDGVYFERAISQSYWDWPSLVTIFTSKYVCGHNINSNEKKLSPDQVTLAQILKNNGYITEAFTCGLDTAVVYSLNRGFDNYDVYNSKDNSLGSFSDIMPKALKMLKENRNKKFLLFLHSYDAHPPYRHSQEKSFDQDYKGVLKDLPLDYNLLKGLKGQQFTQGGSTLNISNRDIEYIIAQYDDSIKYVDEYIGRFINELKGLGLYDNTIIILCADHGEELGERGTFDRFGNQNLYQEVIHVPFLIRYPGLPEQRKGKTIKSLVGLIDITPTILDLLGIPQDKTYNLQGLSLSSLINTDSSGQHRKGIVSEASEDKWMFLSPDGWKLVHSPDGNALYDLNTDLLEQKDQFKKCLDISIMLMKEFLVWRVRNRISDTKDNHIELSPQLIEGLRKAGYW